MSKKKKFNRAKLIANPGSGEESDRGKLLEEVTRRLDDLGIKVDVAVAKPKEKTTPIARRAVKDGYKLIIAMGGDDTIEAIIRGMGKSKTRLAMIPVGTANNLAKGLGIPEDPMAACDLIASRQTRKLDLGRVKMKNGKKLLFFELVILGIGAQIYPSALHVSKGRLSDLPALIQEALAPKTLPRVTVKMDGESSITLDSQLVIVSNVPLIGPNMLVDPNASSDDGLFDISVYAGMSKAELAGYFSKTTNEKPANDGAVQRYRARKVKIKSSPRQQVMADGVMLGKGTAKIKVLPGALRVISPQVGAGVEKPPEEVGSDLPAPVAPVPES